MTPWLLLSRHFCCTSCIYFLAKTLGNLSVLPFYNFVLSVSPAKNEVRVMLANDMISAIHLDEDRSWLLSPFIHLV